MFSQSYILQFCIFAFILMFFSLLVICSSIRSLNGVFTLRLTVFTVIDCSFIDCSYHFHCLSCQYFHFLLPWTSLPLLVCACPHLIYICAFQATSKACAFRQFAWSCTLAREQLQYCILCWWTPHPFNGYLSIIIGGYPIPSGIGSASSTSKLKPGR